MQENHKSYRFVHWAILFAAMSIAVFLVQKNTTDFLASVIPTKQAATFDGTTLPVLRSPKWTSLTSDQYKQDYSKIPADKLMALPKYDPSQLKTSTESLSWKLESDLAIRNAKITFSVPYMGNYKLDGAEYAGSHPAVDIKIPKGTPIYAIANGVASKVTEQNTGFGNHIVIKHENVPSLDDPKAKTTLYSSYNHLDTVLVAQGDVVTKGQQIGTSGQTGTATTPHIHFQIDNDQAPWHPYWPFTYQEASAAGYSFWDAINYGLNADKAKAATINPMLYVQKYLDYSSSTTTPAVNDTSNTVPELPPAIVITPTVTNTTPPVVSEPEPVVDPVITTPVVIPENNSSTVPIAAGFRINHDGSFVNGMEENFEIEAIDADGNIVTDYKPEDGVYLKVTIGSADLPAYIKNGEFVNGKASFKVLPKGETNLQIKAYDNAIEGISEIMQAGMFSDVDESSEHYRAISFLKKHGVIKGYPDGSFKPKQVVSRVEALKFILEGTNTRLVSNAKLPFKDTASTEWYSPYVATGFNKSIIAGYNDSTFKPSNTVNRAEFLKMLLSAMEISMDTIAPRDIYRDVPKDAWFAANVRYARDANIMEASGTRFKPEEGMTREDVAETLYRMIMLKISGEDNYRAGMTLASSDVTRYFN